MARMLVHLDSAHLSWLETAQAEAPEQVERLLGVWRHADAELCLSVHHLTEIAQLSDEASMRRRLQVLRLFPSLSCGLMGWSGVVEQEISRQLIAAATGQPVEDYQTLRGEIFRPIPAEFAEQATFICQKPFGELSKLGKASALIDNHWKRRVELAKLGFPIPKLREASRITPLSLPEQGEEESWQLDKSRRFSGGPAALSKLLRHPLESRAERLRSLGLEGMRCAKGVDHEDLGEIGVFTGMARTASERLRETIPDVDDHVLNLDPWQCPGFRLWAATERARRRAPKDAEPGDVIDSQHLAFVAYTDLAFVDKRTLEFLTQEAKMRRGGMMPVAIAGIRRASKLDDIARAIAEAVGRP